MLLQEGPIFMRMQSEIDLMEGEKRRDEVAFWKNMARSSLYTNLLNAKDKTNSAYGRIQQFEIEIALATMEQGTFNTDFSDRLKKWETAFFELQLNIYSLLYPNANKAYISIYGSHPEHLLKMYLQLFSKKEFLVAGALAIWYREGFNGIDKDADFFGTKREEDASPSPYLKRLIAKDHLQQLDFQPPKAGDRLYGLELEVHSPAITLFLQGEGGIHQWESAPKEALMSYSIDVSPNIPVTPDNIFRQSFYQKPKPRRIIKSGEFTDMKLNLYAHVKPRGIPDLLLEKLDEDFRKALERLFMEGSE